MKKLLFCILPIISSITFAQTSNSNLNSQLGLMKKYFLSENYLEFTNYVYPKVVAMMGGKEKAIQTTKSSIDKMKNDGFKILDINLKNPSGFIKKGNELQFIITQDLLMKTPNGKILGSTTLIGISADNGKNWKFIDTSGKNKETMLKYFPNLSSKLPFIQKTQKSVD